MRLLLTIFSLLLVGSQPDQASQSQSSNRIIVLNKLSHSAWLLDAQNGNKLAEFPTGVAPHEVAISPNKSRAVITNYGDQHPGNSLTVIDLDNEKIHKTISLGKYTRPHGVEWFSDNEKVIVTVEDQKAVIIINVDSGEILKSIGTNEDVSHMLALGPNETMAYVTNLGSGSVSKLDLRKEQVSTTLETGNGTEGVVVIPKTNEVWITNRSANSISVLDIASQKITRSFKSAEFPIRTEVSNHQKWVAVSNAQSSEVSIFDVASHSQIQKISTVENANPGIPIGLTFSDDDRHLYISNSEGNNITVIDTQSWQIINTFETGETPDGIAFISTEE